MPNQSPIKATPYSQYENLESIIKTPSEHSKIYHVNFIKTKLPSKKFKKPTWKLTAPGIHETSCRHGGTILKRVVRKPGKKWSKRQIFRNNRYDSTYSEHIPRLWCRSREHQDKIDKVKRVARPIQKFNSYFVENKNSLLLLPKTMLDVRDVRLWTDTNTPTWKLENLMFFSLGLSSRIQ